MSEVNPPVEDHSQTGDETGPDTDQPEIQAAASPEDEKAKKNRLPEIPIAEQAVITCREDLDRVLKAHQGWIDAVLNPNVEVAAGRANLAGCDLRGYDLTRANLSGANLSGANLEGVELVSANLTVANLQGTILACANLQGAKLTRAKMEGTDLRGADLTGAVVTGVDFSKCLMKTAEKEPERAVQGATAAAAPVLAAEDGEAPETQRAGATASSEAGSAESDAEAAAATADDAGATTADAADAEAAAADAAEAAPESAHDALAAPETTGGSDSVATAETASAAQAESPLT